MINCSTKALTDNSFNTNTRYSRNCPQNRRNHTEILVCSTNALSSRHRVMIDATRIRWWGVKSNSKMQQAAGAAS